MKRIILVITILFINPLYVNAEHLGGFFTGSYSYEFKSPLFSTKLSSPDRSEEANIHHFSIGQEFIYHNYSDRESNTHAFGLNYKFGDRGHIPSLHYNLFYGDEFPLGIGTNVSYNTRQHIWGIAPQVDLLHVGYYAVYKIDITYRYNIYFKRDNSHEIEFKLGILDFMM